MATLLLGAAAAYVLLDYTDYFDDSAEQNTGRQNTAAALLPSATPVPPASSHEAGVPGYTTVYTDLELTSPDRDHEFDLKDGKVTQDASAWYLARQAGAFYIQEDGDAYVPPAGPLTLIDCLKGIETQPTSALPFTTLRADRSFCVRASGGQDVAVVRTLATATTDGPVRVSITYYRRSA
ncbi:hypothetical protein [Streptomyces sp. CBMA123]|uniref:hypothetical protein n=1 Tax=Streptomyces sp. CBMA123 TaxID=1896313 RepID=UPI001661DC30|nr:hypothetical protein [Streptomyces sp. CBMA123]